MSYNHYDFHVSIKCEDIINFKKQFLEKPKLLCQTFTAFSGTIYATEIRASRGKGINISLQLFSLLIILLILLKQVIIFNISGFFKYLNYVNMFLKTYFASLCCSNVRVKHEVNDIFKKREPPLFVFVFFFLCSWMNYKAHLNILLNIKLMPQII